MSAEEPRTGRLPTAWLVVMALVCLAGVILLACAGGLRWDMAMSRLGSMVPRDRWGTFWGLLLVSTSGAHLLGSGLRHVLRQALDLKGDSTVPDSLSPALVGICESIIYPLALFAGKGEFIGIWLAVKVAGQWARWGGAHAEDEKKTDEGRRRFNAFLVGNAVTVLLGAVAWVALEVWVKPS